MRQLHGRMVALEMVCQSLLATHLGDNFDDPLDAADRVKHAMFSSAQNVDRATGEYEDTVWAEAFESLNRILENVRTRLQSNRNQG